MPAEDCDIVALDDRTVERIAAGEVVERPASVVKELLENSLDADADRIDIDVVAGGTESVRVRDDGDGMTETELRRAVEEHTTSKITEIGDLEGGVGTLGFRGEALHAIGAVSRLTIRSRPRPAVGPGDVADGQPTDATARASEAVTGTELTVEGGDVTNVAPTGCPVGTTVEVADLFYNVPARRKYLKTESTEFAHVNKVTTSYALANPDVAIRLRHDDRETFATTGNGDRQEAVMAVYGRQVARSMIEVDPDELPEGPLEGVEGLVSHPETNRASRDYLSTFVNGRYVTASQVRQAVVDAYETQLASDRFPFAVLDLSLDPGSVDVNVHPRKLEVRFADEEAVRTQIEAAVTAALMGEGLIRSRAPRGSSAADEARVEPGDGRDDGDEREAGAQNSATDRHHRMPDRVDGASGSGDSETAGGQAESDAAGSPDPVARSVNHPGSRERHSTTDALASDPGRGESPESRSGEDPEAADSRGGDWTGPRHRKFRPAYDQTKLGEPAGERDVADEADHRRAAAGGECEETFESLPPVRLMGQFRDTYVLAEGPEGLLLIDQHAADERINYETLLDSFEGDIETQALASPVELELTARETELFETHTKALAQLGFHASFVDDRTINVTTVPSLVAEAADPELLRDVLAEFVGGEQSAAQTVEAAAEDFLADLACYPSITGNTSLTEGSTVELLEQLDACENPWACPHGRPVVIRIATDEIEARFERDYPGHEN